MFAIVEIAGKQYKVSEKDTLEVDRLNQEKGKVTFDKVLLFSKDPKSVQIGTPYLNGAKVEAEILEHKKGDKIRVFKMKPKKRYERTIGHRKHLSVLEIKSISPGKATVQAKPAPKSNAKAVETKAEPKAKAPAKKKVKAEAPVQKDAKAE